MDKLDTESPTASNPDPPYPAVPWERWEQTLQALPDDLERSAYETGALRRRRGIRCAADLLRIVLAYAVLDWPLRMVGAWCVLQGVADISDVALLKRLRHCQTWLGRLIVQLLQQRQVPLEQRTGVRLRLRDATVITRPGSQGTDWRVHLSLNLDRMGIDGVEITTASGSESLARFASQPGDIDVADRGYASAAGIETVLRAQGEVVVRSGWKSLALWDSQDSRLDLIAWLREAFASSDTDTHERPVWLPGAEGQPYRLRLIARQLPAEAAERARRKARQVAQKHGRTPDERTLFACGFLLVLTSLPARTWSASSVLALYRIRWQVELVFKRLKSLLNFDGLRAHDADLAQTYLLGKLLAALLLEAQTNTVSQQVPEWFISPQRPVSLWRLTTLLWQQLRQLVCGSLTLGVVVACLPRLQRFLCEPPRKRPQQLAQARNLLARLSVVNVHPTLLLS